MSEKTIKVNVLPGVALRTSSYSVTNGPGRCRFGCNRPHRSDRVIYLQVVLLIGPTKNTL